MEMLVATWSVRLALVGALLVGWISLGAGLPLMEVALRAGITAFLLTLAGRQLIGFLETPEQKLARAQAKHARKAARKGGDA